MHPRLFTLPAVRPLRPRSRGPSRSTPTASSWPWPSSPGLWVAARQAKRAGLDANRVTDMAVYVLIAGLLGAKVMLLVSWTGATTRRTCGDLWSLFQSGGVFYGGLLAGMPVAWWYVRRYALPGWATADVLAPGVVIGQAIGRLGCFAAGCCFGKPATVPWAVTFTDTYAMRHVGTPLDIPVHPTQIYESLACFLIFFFLLWLAPRKRFDGQVVLAYVVLYSVARFTLEFFRGDPDRGGIYGVSTSQIIAIVLVLAAAALYPRLRRQPITPAPAPA